MWRLGQEPGQCDGTGIVRETLVGQSPVRGSAPGRWCHLAELRHFGSLLIAGCSKRRPWCRVLQAGATHSGLL